MGKQSPWGYNSVISSQGYKVEEVYGPGSRSTNIILRIENICLELKEKQAVMGRPSLLCSELLSSKCLASAMGLMEEEQSRCLCLDFVMNIV